MAGVMPKTHNTKHLAIYTFIHVITDLEYDLKYDPDNNVALVSVMLYTLSCECKIAKYIHIMAQTWKWDELPFKA